MKPSSPNRTAYRAPSNPSTGTTILRFVYLIALLFAFLVAIETMSKAIKGLADTGMLGGSGDELFSGVSNPFAGLAIGVLFTVFVQSSSTTTSTIVAVVGSGALSIEHAVPMILGANIGTTITNTIVSVAHVRQSRDFRRAFAAATVHDFFNLMMVAVILPIELLTGVLARTAGWIASHLGGVGGGGYSSPLKSGVKATHKALKGAIEGIDLSDAALGWALLAVGIVLTFISLLQVTTTMKKVMAGRIETAMNRALHGQPLKGVVVGVGMTAAVQSSSVTTSLLVPMCASGVMSLKNAFPIMLGANIGTTLTALLASLAADLPAALTIALVHVLFNLVGVSLCISMPPVRLIPIRLARGLALRASRSPVWVFGYVFGVFVALPMIGWTIWRQVG